MENELRPGYDQVVRFDFQSRTRIEETGAPQETLKGGGGDGTSGGMTEDWKAGVDRQLTQLHSDVRALLNRGVAAVVALAILIGGLYLYTNQKFDAVNSRLTQIEVQQAKMEATISGKLDLIAERLPAKK